MDMTENGLGLVSLANELEAFISAVIADVSTEQKYGGTLFTLRPQEKEGQFCGVFIYAKHVQLSFSQGALLTDPQKRLSGSGKYRRHINYQTIEDVDFAYLERLLNEASTLKR